ncbi:response regulator [Candidatus Riflebacteria bacterium]
MKKRVLIVDDDPENVRILRKLLKKEYELAEAENGINGLEKVESFEPDIILLDNMMPEMNGIEFTQKLRSNTKHNFRKVLMVSGKGALEERLEGYSAGVDDYVVKPFNKGELLAKMQVFLRLKHMEELNNIKGSLLTLISHETNTPVSIILGYARILLSTPGLKEEKKKDLLNKIVKAGCRLENFGKKTLLLCQLRGTDALELKKKTVNSTVSSWVDEKKQENADRYFGLKIADDFSFMADDVHFKTAFSMLAENAVKFSPLDTPITIECEIFQDEGNIHFLNRGKIDPEVRDSLFNEFSVADIAHHKEGLGLSLPIVKSIMQLHGGTVTVVEEEGEWVRATLSFPKV